jgi:hypothetical protein
LKGEFFVNIETTSLWPHTVEQSEFDVNMILTKKSQRRKGHFPQQYELFVALPTQLQLEDLLSPGWT